MIWFTDVYLIYFRHGVVDYCIAAANGLFTEQSLDLVYYCMLLMGGLLHVFVGFAIDPADIVACSFSAVGLDCFVEAKAEW